MPDLRILRAGAAEVTEHELDESHIAFFVRVNPEHYLGQALACLAALSLDNLSRAGRRIIGFV